MLGNAFKKMIGQDPLSKTYKEYASILELESKRLNLAIEYGRDNDIITTQEEIIKNNFLTLSHVYETLEKPKLVDGFAKSEYFNMQGTTPNVMVFERHDIQIKGQYNHKITASETEVTHTRYDDNDIAEIIELEVKFEKVNINKLGKIAGIKLKEKIKEKIAKKVHLFAQKYVGNEEMVELFLMSNLDAEATDFQTNFVLERIDFLYKLTKATNSFIRNSDNFTPRNKDLVVVDMGLFDASNQVDIITFLETFKQKAFDFIVKQK